MTWRPDPQPECGPDCTCTGPFESENDRLAEYVRSEHDRALTDPSEPRTCAEADPCSFCGPVERFWAGDPAPVPEPPHPSDTAWTPEQERIATGNIPGRGTHVTIISTPSSPSDFLRRRLNARKDRP